jgi:hypothetical protein
MTVLLGLLVVFWLIVVWVVVLGLLGFALVYFAVLAWRIVWAVGSFLVRLVVALIYGPERRQA